MSNNDMIVEILKIVNDLREETKDIRREIQKSREIEEAHWQENERRWKKYEEDRAKDKEENERRWKRYEENRAKDRKDILGILTSYEISISEKLGDPNVGKMRKLV